MSIFESINNTSSKASDIGEEYLKKSKEYYRLKIFHQLTISVSMIAKALVIGSVLFIGLIFLALAGAIAIGHWLGNLALGYLIIAGLFLIFGGVIYYSRHLINRKIIKAMSPKFFEL